MKQKDLFRALQLEFRQASYLKLNSYDVIEKQYYQGKIDLVNDLLCLMGSSRLDQSDEIMASQTVKLSRNVIDILDNKTSSLPEPFLRHGATTT